VAWHHTPWQWQYLPPHPLVGQVVVGAVQPHLVVVALAPRCVAALVRVVGVAGTGLVVTVYALVWVRSVVWVRLAVPVGGVPTVVGPLAVRSLVWVGFACAAHRIPLGLLVRDFLAVGVFTCGW
jgi:hypothetical protein